MPVFEGLFLDPDHNNHIQALLFIMADWHTNAKLCLHTDTTIEMLKGLTCSFGFLIYHFANKICILYDARELLKEEVVHAWHWAKKVKHGDAPALTTPLKGALKKCFNLLTYKLHTMGDYVYHIIQFGTTDLYSTQMVSSILKYFITVVINKSTEWAGTSQC